MYEGDDNLEDETLRLIMNPQDNMDIFGAEEHEEDDEEKAKHELQDVITKQKLA
jgi:hypothetical protein